MTDDGQTEHRTPNTERRLLALARRNAAAYAAMPGALAVAVTGSVAEGRADALSDIDTVVFWSAVPDEAALSAARDRLGGSERIFLLGDPAEGGCAEGYRVEGVKCDFAHCTLERWHADTADVLERHNPDSPYQKALDGILKCVPLHGAPLIEELRARAAQYPDGLARAMARKHLSFYPRWVPERMALERGDLLWFTQMLVEAQTNVAGILFGLNRVYHWGEVKRMDETLGGLPLAPPDLPARMKRVLRAEPHLAAAELYALIEETLALVAEHLPDVDLSAAHRRLGLPCPARE